MFGGGYHSFLLLGGVVGRVVGRAGVVAGFAVGFVAAGFAAGVVGDGVGGATASSAFFLSTTCSSLTVTTWSKKARSSLYVSTPNNA